MIVKSGGAIPTVGHVLSCIVGGILTFGDLVNNIYTTEFLTVVVSA